MTRDKPSRDMLLRRLSPLTVPMASSTGFVMRVSISSGAAFSYVVTTVNCGYVMGGNNSWGSRMREMMPKRLIPANIIIVVTGLAMEKRGKFIY